VLLFYYLNSIRLILVLDWGSRSFMFDHSYAFRWPSNVAGIVSAALSGAGKISYKLNAVSLLGRYKMKTKSSYTELERKVTELKDQLDKIGIDLLWEIFSQSPVPTLIRNVKKGRNIRYNQAMHKLTGYSQDEVPDVTTWLTKIYPDKKVRKNVQGLINKTIKRQLELKGYEIVITRKDGQERHVEFSVFNVFIQGKPSDFQVVEAIDITERKRAVEELKQLNKKLQQWNQELDLRVSDRTRELQESENRLKMALEGANEGLWVIDFKENKMIFSGETAEMLGYNLEELGSTEEQWDKFTHPEDWPIVEQRLTDHYEGRTGFYEAEYRAKTKDGGWKWILGHGRVMKRDEKGRPIQAIGTHVDITKLKETEIELRRSEEKFRSLVENAPFGLLIVESDRTIGYFNPQFKSIFGYSKTELQKIDNWLKKAYPDELYRKKVKSVWDKAINKPNEMSLEPHQFRIATKNGESKIVRVKFVPLKEKSCLVTYEDITETAKAHEALEKREQELELKTTNLEEVNTALRVLLKRREEDKAELEEKVLYNMKDLVLPYLTKLEQSRLSESQKSFLTILKSNLNDIVSPFSRRLAASHLNMTPREIQVANLLKEDRITKEIAELLHMSESSVEFHRHNIRKKLGLVGKKVNLKTYLQSLQA
jgi:PAS domain S-box-containing protein